MRRHRPLVDPALAVVLVLGLAALLGGCGRQAVAGAGASGPAPVPVAPAAQRSDGSGMLTPSAKPAPPPKPDGFEVASPPSAVRVPGPSAPPVRLSIPSIGVSTPLDRLGLAPDGSMEVPSQFARAGWFSAGTLPGQQGPAVIAGHVDSRTGPAVFYRLRELRPGDRVEVERADGVRLRFVVEERAQYHKASLPTEAVFGPVAWPALRLVTCTGTFDRSRGSYRDNLVVYARLASAGK
jgi:sortase (surface protein transpeptidase)